MIRYAKKNFQLGLSSRDDSAKPSRKRAVIGSAMGFIGTSKSTIPISKSTELCVVNLIKDEFNCQGVDLGSSIGLIGIDSSYQLSKLASAISKEFGLVVSEAELKGCATVGGIVKLINERDKV